MDLPTPVKFEHSNRDEAKHFLGYFCGKFNGRTISLSGSRWSISLMAQNMVFTSLAPTPNYQKKISKSLAGFSQAHNAFQTLP